jgi:hypothetical protein
LIYFLATSSIAVATDPPRAAPANGLMFPESVERAMMGEAAARSNPNPFGTGTTTIDRMNFETPTGPIDLIFSRPVVAPVHDDAPSLRPRLKDFPEMKQQFGSVVQLLMDHKFDGVIQEIRRQPWKNSTSKLPSEFVIAYLFLDDAGQSKQARYWLEQAVVKTSDDPEPWEILGDIALDDNRLAEAGLCYAKAKSLLAQCANAAGKERIEKRVSGGLSQLAERRKKLQPVEAEQ